eukprot:5670611-Prymnesium_polylepis.1
MTSDTELVVRVRIPAVSAVKPQCRAAHTTIIRAARSNMSAERRDQRAAAPPRHTAEAGRGASATPLGNAALRICTHTASNAAPNTLIHACRCRLVDNIARWVDQS